MPSLEHLFEWLGYGAVLAPALLVAVIGLPLAIGYPLSEKGMARATQIAVFTGLSCCIAILVLMLSTGIRDVPIEMRDWVTLPKQAHFQLHFSFDFDRLSVPFAILSYVLVGTIGAFASRYLHREPGYNRFFLLNAIFLLGMIIATISRTIETLFLGWELVGLSSALLVAYFHERKAPVINGQRVWSIYRVADAAFLIAAVALHHMHGEGQFAAMVGQWPEVSASADLVTPEQALIVGLLLLIAVAGKSALIPFSGWLPRAMEGPTPSSAIFYGALSVHLGTFLLLRFSPLLSRSPTLCCIVIALGIATAFLASLSARVQSDVKTALAFASLMQVGIITAEIGVAGLLPRRWGYAMEYFALVHIIGHACLRTLQLLRAPNLLHDYHALENAIGAHLPSRSGLRAPGRFQVFLYRLGIERGYLDAIIDEYVVRPFVAVCRWFDGLERRWTDSIEGKRPSAAGEHLPPLTTEELS